MSGVASWAWRNRSRIGKAVKGVVSDRDRGTEHRDDAAGRA